MSTRSSSDFQYIDSPQALQQLCTQLQDAEVIALDTEFMREKTYYARLCLIQIATPTLAACIDPLALPDLDPLHALLEDTNKIKLLHAARQDLEIFHDLWQHVPEPVFDTQIAAALLGYSDQIGYANLVESLLGVQLDKSSARTDWSQRPLSQTQLDYAVDDVRYLIQLYPRLCEKLQQLARMDWLADDFAALVNPALYEKTADSSWIRVSGHGKLKPQQLAILQRLANWRETHARERNKPRKWILSDDLMLNIARQTPDSPKALARIRGIPAGVVEHSATAILDAVRSALALPPDAWPTPAKKYKPSAAEECLSDTLMAYLKLIANENNISAAALATRKEIEKLTRGERDLPILQGWRAKLAGDSLLAMIEGRITLQVQAGRVVASTVNQD